ncbi:unnamed protein product [Owenia fusiformis]|nr:unnamed protein product [Owenia fusiformis]
MFWQSVFLASFVVLHCPTIEGRTIGNYVTNSQSETDSDNLGLLLRAIRLLQDNQEKQDSQQSSDIFETGVQNADEQIDLGKRCHPSLHKPCKRTDDTSLRENKIDAVPTLNDRTEKLLLVRLLADYIQENSRTF